MTEEDKKEEVKDDVKDSDETVEIETEEVTTPVSETIEHTDITSILEEYKQEFIALKSTIEALISESRESKREPEAVDTPEEVEDTASEVIEDDNEDDFDSDELAEITKILNK